MTEPVELRSILDNVDKQLDEDLSYSLAKATKSKNVQSKNAPDTRKKFARYLISVASHPIGLRASLSPFNCSQELMLVYLMNMFKLTEAQIKKALGLTETAPESPKPIKRHSWRPELRIRLNAPKFYRSEETYLDNLSVRVYLFKNVEHTKESRQTSPKSAKNRNLLKLLQKLGSNKSSSTRPINEMLYLIRFAKIQAGLNKGTYKMSNSVRNSNRPIQDDLYLRIRRSDCELATSRTLRFEFWLDISRLTKLQRFRHFAKHLVCNAYFFSPKNSTTSGEEFYGAIDIKLSQIPSYASKRSYPVAALNGRRVNNCEISIEARNRRLFDDDDVPKDTRVPPGDKPRQSSFKFVLAHLRLYANCLLYQLSDLDDLLFIVDESYQSNIVLDNLLYVPAYTLINQHRLQANLNQLEDQSLRRIAMLLLLLKLDASRAKIVNGTDVGSMKSILLSIIHNEYLFAQRPIDDKTLQEIDPFNEDKADATRNLIVNLEFSSLKIVVDSFLANRLRKWFMRERALKSYQREINPERHLTLRALKLMKTITSHFRKCSIASVKLKCQATELSGKINNLLSEIIREEVTSRVEKIVARDERPNHGTTKKRVLRAGRAKTVVSDNKIVNLWRRLLFDVRFINRDMVLYWSKRGLSSLQFDEKQIVDRMIQTEKSERRNLRSVVEMKMQCFLAN